MWRRLFFVAAAAAALLLATQGTAMAKMVIFSAIKGRVLLNGKPAVGAVLVREFNWGWKDENGTDRTTTDASGAFSLPVIERSSLLGSILPHEPLVRQVITVKYDGKDYDAWAFYKHNYRENGENEGKPIDVTCRLEAERKRHGDVMGLCEFN